MRTSQASSASTRGSRRSTSRTRRRLARDASLPWLSSRLCWSWTVLNSRKARSKPADSSRWPCAWPAAMAGLHPAMMAAGSIHAPQHTLPRSHCCHEVPTAWLHCTFLASSASTKANPVLLQGVWHVD